MVCITGVSNISLIFSLLYFFVENRAGIIKDSQLLSMMAILSGTYSVDTFFFLRYVSDGIF